MNRALEEADQSTSAWAAEPPPRQPKHAPVERRETIVKPGAAAVKKVLVYQVSICRTCRAGESCHVAELESEWQTKERQEDRMAEVEREAERDTQKEREAKQQR